jgi:hypothetical protein
MPIKDKAGAILTCEKDQEERWTEHFREILNRPPPAQEHGISDPEYDLNISTEPSQIPEISAIKSLKSGRAPGSGDLNEELFKANPHLAATIISGQMGRHHITR